MSKSSPRQKDFKGRAKRRRRDRTNLVLVIGAIALVAALAIFLLGMNLRGTQPTNDCASLVEIVNTSELTITASGLQYVVLAEGAGPRPTAADRVTVHYRGCLTNGRQFDSSYDRGSPNTFPLTGVIRGWTEGVQLMPVGSRYVFYIPSELAYGVQGVPGTIPSNSDLIFEIELIGIG